MKWDELLNENIGGKYNGQVKTSIECPQCGRQIYLDKTIILTSFPGKYRYWCSCGWSGTAHTEWRAEMEEKDEDHD